MMASKAPHETFLLPWNSATTADMMTAARARHHVQALVEIDVTTARERIAAHRQRTGEALSFTGWLAFCLARTLADHPALNVHRLGTLRAVRFADADVMLMVEREAGGERRAVPLVVRAAQARTVAQIHAEIRAAQGQAFGPDDMVVGGASSTHWLGRIPSLTRLYPLVPAPVRGLFWTFLGRNAFAAKRVMGTAGITSVGMFARVPGWPIVAGLHTVELAVGSVVRKPRMAGDRIVPRDVLSLTVLVDHDLVDGAEAARFVARLAERLERADGLDAPA